MMTLNDYYKQFEAVAKKFEHTVAKLGDMTINEGEINETDNTLEYIWYNRDTISLDREKEILAHVTQAMREGVVFDHARILIHIF